MMPWVKLDEGFPEHPKVLAAGVSAAWLHVCALAYCNRNLTDGKITTAVLPRLSQVKRPAVLAQQLVDVGLWERARDGFLIHDYLSYQPSKATVEAERAKARDRMARVRGSTNVRPNSADDVRPNNSRSSPEVRSTRSDPSRSDPSPSSSSSSTGSGKATTNGHQDEDDDRIVHAIEIHAAWAARSADNPRSYGRTVAINDRKDSIPDLQQHIQRHPSATAQTLARAVFSMSETDVHSYDPRPE